MIFRKGRVYVAGFDLPPFVAFSVVKSGIEARGFRVLSIWDCEDGGVPFAVTGKCGDEYDTIGVGERTGLDAELELPSRVAWVVELDPGDAPPLGPPVPRDPSRMSSAQLHRWARPVLIRVWQAKPRPVEMTLPGLQVVQSIAGWEGLYGFAEGLGPMRGRHNWGNVSCPCSGVGTGPCVRHAGQCYRVYGSAEEGCADFLRELFRRAPVVRAFASDPGDVGAVVGAMKETLYFTALESVYANGVYDVAASVASALKEPRLAHLGSGVGRILVGSVLAVGAGLAAWYLVRHAKRTRR